MVQSRQTRAEAAETVSREPEDYDVGMRVSCQATMDGAYHPAEVVERRADSGGEVLYYVHYTEFDKRLDEWVPASRLAALTGAGSGEGPGVGGPAAGPVATGDQKMTRRLKRQYAEMHHVGPGVEELPPLDQHAEKEHQEKTKVKNIQTIEFGRYEMDTWYYSPYPEPAASCDKLYICEYTLKYFRKKKTLLRHLAKTPLRRPPGDEIYRSPPLIGAGKTRAASGEGKVREVDDKDGVDDGKARAGESKAREGEPRDGGSPAPALQPNAICGAATDPPLCMFEVDGRKAKVYCQNLCLLSKLFLDHKTLYYDVDPFLFYVLCERDARGHHLVGYFSKEKDSTEGNNLACILTLPAHQRKGYGRFLIAFSYELSRREGRLGSPERPLSDLGAVSYRSYWMRAILEALRGRRGALSLRDISEATGIRTDDVVRTLESLSLIRYWKGDHIIAVTQKIVEEHLRTIAGQRTIDIDPARLHWTPYPRPDQQRR